ncbi:MAG: ATP-binding protein [Pseudomonadota bacterium]
MHLRTHIFVWVVVATVIPLTALGLGATWLGERAQREETGAAIIDALNNLTAEIDRQLEAERAMVASLTEAPGVRNFRPVLEAARAGRRHPDYRERTAELADFLAVFQQTLPGDYTIRLLDHRGNTVLKVRDGEHRPAQYPGLGPLPLAEPELEAETVRHRLADIGTGEVRHLLLPQSRQHRDQEMEPALLDLVAPLGGEGQTPAGYLAVSPDGSRVERILAYTTSLPEGTLAVAEIQPGDNRRNGMLLHHSADNQRFDRLRRTPRHLEEAGLGGLRTAVMQRPYGHLADRPRLHFVEYYPYPGRLVSWVVALEAEESVFAEPFARIRGAIWVFTGIALVLALLLIPLGARVIARPVCRLARRLKAYADGDHSARVEPAGPTEIRELGAAFNYMADTLERARTERDEAQQRALQSARLASIGEMAAGIGHEINNPLNNILSLTKLMDRETDRPDRLTRDIEAVREEALRASETVRGILNFARQVPPDFHPVEVGGWLAESTRLVAERARAAGVGIGVEAAPELWVRGDRHLLQQALANLVDNAVAASPAGGSVEVTATAEGDEVVVTVTDQGAGIEPERLDRVFDPFFTTKAVGEGSGLGLSVTLGIVEHHGGALDIRNDAAGGVTATIRLPRAESDHE